MKETMYCPRCLSPLIKGKGTKVYETLAEHVLSPNDRVYPKGYYICSKDICFTQANGYFWDWYGDSYCDKILENNLFALSCSSAVNSQARRSSIEERRKQRTILYLYWFKVYVESTPIPDKIGLNIPMHKLRLKACTRDGTMWVEYTPGIVMFFWNIKRFNYTISKLFKEPNNIWVARDLLEFLQSPGWDKRWWKRLSSWVLDKLYPGLKETLKCIENK